MLLRAYGVADRSACLAVFDSNVPDFFAPHEREGLVSFLDDEPARFGIEYFVLVDGDRAIACGGVGRHHYGPGIHRRDLVLALDATTTAAVRDRLECDMTERHGNTRDESPPSPGDCSGCDGMRLDRIVRSVERCARNGPERGGWWRRGRYVRCERCPRRDRADGRLAGRL